jgi:hypothetical protein
MYLFDYFQKKILLRPTNKQNMAVGRKKREIEMYFNSNNKPQQLE